MYVCMYVQCAYTCTYTSILCMSMYAGILRPYVSSYVHLYSRRQVCMRMYCVHIKRVSANTYAELCALMWVLACMHFSLMMHAVQCKRGMLCNAKEGCCAMQKRDASNRHAHRVQAVSGNRWTAARGHCMRPRLRCASTGKSLTSD
jgi:hypothetical protein